MPGLAQPLMQPDRSMRGAVLTEVQTLVAFIKSESPWLLVHQEYGEEATTVAAVDVYLRNLGRLRDELHMNSTTVGLSCSSLLAPFLHIVRAPETTARFTGAALQGILRMLRCGILGLYFQGAEDAIMDTVDALSHCKFMSSGPGTDEAVLIQILEALSSCVRQGASALLSDAAMWDILQACFRLTDSSAQHSLSIAVVAQETSYGLIRSLFQQLEDVVDAKPVDNDGRPRRRYGLPCAVKAFAFLCHRVLEDLVSTKESALGDICFCLKTIQEALEGARSSLDKVPALLTLVKDDLCRIILSAGRYQRPDSYKATIGALQLFHILWTTSRRHLKMQVQAIFNGVILGTLQLSYSSSLKAHGDKGFPPSFVLGPFSRQSYAETEIVLEFLTDLLTEEGILADLFLNYDADVHSSDILVQTARALSLMASARLPEEEEQMVSGSLVWDVTGTFSKLALGALHNMLHTLVRRCTALPTVIPPEVREKVAVKLFSQDLGQSRRLSPAELQSLRNAKKAMVEGARLFNQSAKKGLRYLQEQSILPIPLTPKSVASFLRALPEGLDKVAVGAYIGTVGKDPIGKNGEATYEGETVEFHEQVLKDFVDTFDFRSQTLLDSLRMFLSSFRLPGEAQQIDRILQCFAHQVYRDCADKPLLATVDVAYLLSFSIIMLNTDLHNPNIRPEKRMSLQDFRRNNVNYGEEVSRGVTLPEEYLDNIYQSIQSYQIRTCDDGSHGEVTHDRWKDLLRQAESDRSYEQLTTHERQDFEATDSDLSELELLLSQSIYDELILSSFWEVLLHGLTRAFENSQRISRDAEQVQALKRVTDVMVLLSRLGCSHKRSDVVDAVVNTLCRASHLMEPLPKDVEGTRGDNSGPGSRRPPSEALEHFMEQYCSDRLQQVATVAAFSIAKNDGQEVLAAWRALILCLARLRQMQVLPSAFFRSVSSELLTQDERSWYLERARKATSSVQEEGSGKIKKESLMDNLVWLLGSFSASTPVDEPVERRDSVEDLIVMPCSPTSCASGTFPLHSSGASPGLRTSATATNLSAPARFDLQRQFVQDCLAPCDLSGFLLRTKHLPAQSFEGLVEVLISLAEAPLGARTDTGSAGSLESVKTEGEGAAKCPLTASGSLFCEHLLSEVLLCNRQRIHTLWPSLQKHFVRSLLPLKAPSPLSFIHFLSADNVLTWIAWAAGQVLLEHSELAGEVEVTLGEVLELPDTVTLVLSCHLSATSAFLIATSGTRISRPTTWSALFLLLLKTSQQVPFALAQTRTCLAHVFVSTSLEGTAPRPSSGISSIPPCSLAALLIGASLASSKAPGLPSESVALEEGLTKLLLTRPILDEMESSHNSSAVEADTLWNGPEGLEVFLLLRLFSFGAWHPSQAVRLRCLNHFTAALRGHQIPRWFLSLVLEDILIPLCSAVLHVEHSGYGDEGKEVRSNDTSMLPWLSALQDHFDVTQLQRNPWEVQLLSQVQALERPPAIDFETRCAAIELLEKFFFELLLGSDAVFPSDILRRWGVHLRLLLQAVIDSEQDGEKGQALPNAQILPGGPDGVVSEHSWYLNLLSRNIRRLAEVVGEPLEIKAGQQVESKVREDLWSITRVGVEAVAPGMLESLFKAPDPSTALPPLPDTSTASMEQHPPPIAPLVSQSMADARNSFPPHFVVLWHGCNDLGLALTTALVARGVGVKLVTRSSAGTLDLEVDTAVKELLAELRTSGLPLELIEAADTKLTLTDAMELMQGAVGVYYLVTGTSIQAPALRRRFGFLEGPEPIQRLAENAAADLELAVESAVRAEISKFIFTSSLSAALPAHTSPLPAPITADSWSSPPSEPESYIGGGMGEYGWVDSFVEQCVWKRYLSQVEEEGGEENGNNKTRLVVLVPGIIIGEPSGIQGKTGGRVPTALNCLLDVPEVLELGAKDCVGFIDLNDCVDAHVEALLNEAMCGRYILCNDVLRVIELPAAIRSALHPEEQNSDTSEQFEVLSVERRSVEEFLQRRLTPFKDAISSYLQGCGETSSGLI